MYCISIDRITLFRGALVLRAAIRQTLFRQNGSRENLSNFNDVKLS